MKLSQLKEEIKGIIRERGVAAIQKEYQKTIEEIEKALDFYKKNKNTDKKDAFVKVLKQLGEKKKALQNELDLKVQSMYRNAELKADESVNEDANPKFFPSGKKEWAKSATFFDADKVDILLITSKYKDVNDAYYIFKKDGRFIGSADSIKGGKPSGTKVNVKLSDVSNAKSIGDLKKMIGESVVNEISAIDGLTDVIDGRTSSIEGVKLSKDMAEHIMYWIRTSPYGKKYGIWFKRNGIAKLLPIAFMWGLDRYLPSNLKGELATLKSKYGKSKNESVVEAKNIKWQDVEVGDSANVTSINKTGVIIKTYGRKFHIKFANGTTKTYDANELEFIKESVNEVVSVSQVRSTIAKVKKQLIQKWKQKGGYENFGEKEGRMLSDKFNANPYGSSDERRIHSMIQDFENWAMNYDGRSESVNEEKPGLWANIRAKQARGEKPAHGNSQAHKDAVEAGKKINKEESVNETSFQKGKTYGGTKCDGGCFIGKQGLVKIIKISKELPNNTFIFRDDNYSGLQPHFIKNGVIAKANTIGNPSYDLDRNKVRNLNIGKDVILSLRIAE